MHNESFSLPRHPLGVKPAGNVYTAPAKLLSPFWRLPDELVIEILEYLDPTSLSSLGLCCKALYAFSRLDELWKTFCISDPPPEFKWHGTWYASYAGIKYSSNLAKVSCDDLCSDVIYRPFLCAHTPLEPYTTNIPKRNAIARLDGLSAADFTNSWTDKPFILEGLVTRWPAYQRWTAEALLKQYGDVAFRAEAVDWPFHTYMDYMNNSSDESPLYLFDRGFVEKMDVMVGKNGAYWSPECFGEDLFAVLRDQRPDSRWLIIGPERSGSTFHKDPNATSAWNAVLSGSKYWIMFPSSASYPPPPGVYVSADQSEVTSPLSIAEWLLAFHAEARRQSGCVEGICKAGEVLHVPSGWWHLVVNLSPSIAITQNFIPEAHLPNVLEFLKHKADQVSGFKDSIIDPYSLFVDRMRNDHKDILEQALEKVEKKKQSKKRTWDDLMDGKSERNGHEKKRNGFSFGFGDDDDEEVP